MFHIRHVIKYTLPDWLSYLKHPESHSVKIVQNISASKRKRIWSTPDCSPRWPLQFSIKKSQFCQMYVSMPPGESIVCSCFAIPVQRFDRIPEPIV